MSPSREPPVRLSVVIPLLNEAEGLPDLRAALTRAAAEWPGVGAEFVLVDDGSTDATPTLLAAWADADERVVVVTHAKRCGSHAALRSGLAAAQGEAAVLLSADLQDPPELVPEMLARRAEGAEVVWGLRDRATGLAERIFYALLRAGLPQVPPQGADFALLDRTVIDAVLARPRPTGYIFGEIFEATDRHAFVPYERRARKHGRSRWTRRGSARLALDALLAFTPWPARLAYGGAALAPVLGLAGRRLVGGFAVGYLAFLAALVLEYERRILCDGAPVRRVIRSPAKRGTLGS